MCRKSKKISLMDIHQLVAFHTKVAYTPSRLVSHLYVASLETTVPKIRWLEVTLNCIKYSRCCKCGDNPHPHCSKRHRE